MDLRQPIACTLLSNDDKAALRKGSITTYEELVLANPRDAASKCRISVYDFNRIVQLVARDGLLPSLRKLDDAARDEEGVCTTGDSDLDKALGGGLRVGMVWEIVGESAAGKTQLALQISLCVRVPVALRGLNGSVCYLTTSSTLPTSRLLEISRSHPYLLSLPPEHRVHDLEDINTISTPSIQVLLHVLTSVFPSFIDRQSMLPSAKPVKLLVIDALAELFHSCGKTSTRYLVERSQQLSELSAVLHRLAVTHRLAVLVVNEVIDVFPQQREQSKSGELIYHEQAHLFGSGSSIPGEDTKQASLGLVWANQVNARILLSRTGRRRYLDATNGAKRHKSGTTLSNLMDAPHGEDAVELTMIRRLNVVFSAISAPISLDYIVTTEGIQILPSDEHSQSPTGEAASMGPPAVIESSIDASKALIQEEAGDNDDEWDRLLLNDESYDGLDWDALEHGLSQGISTG